MATVMLSLLWVNGEFSALVICAEWHKYSNEIFLFHVESTKTNSRCSVQCVVHRSDYGSASSLST